MSADVHKLNPPPVRRISVSVADPYRVGPIARLVSEWIESLEVPLSKPDPHGFVTWVSEIIRDGYVLTAHSGQRMVGTAAIQRVPVPWNKFDFVWDGIWFYVTKSYRKTEVADSLMTALKLRAARDKTPLLLNMVGDMHMGLTSDCYNGNKVGTIYQFGD